MKHFDNPEFWQALQSSDVKLLFDFDGTLAPIVEKPENAFMTQQTLTLLKEIKKIFWTGIVSGRSLEDVKNRIPIELDFYSGNHGIESPFVSQSVLRKIKYSMENIKDICSKINKDVYVEDKGLSIAVHFRGLEKPETALAEYISAFDSNKNVKLIPGILTLNLLPNNYFDKGWIMQKLMKEYKRSTFVFIGDDITDEYIFKIKAEQLLSISVGNKKESASKYFIEDQKEINILLKKILENRNA
jgi:trehalose 6-phosphate phosphatase